MTHPSLLYSIAAFWFLAVITPGPNSLLVAQSAVLRSRKSSLQHVMGIILGTFVWSLLGYLGIRAVFSAVPRLYWLIKTAGSAYLVFFGLRMILRKTSAKEKHREEAQKGTDRALRNIASGTMTSLSNPKTAIFISSLFASVIPQDTPFKTGLACILVIILITSLWYSLIALVFSLQGITKRREALEKYISRISGGLFVFLGLRLALKD